jgi:phage major head subunit gpT-like protein
MDLTPSNLIALRTQYSQIFQESFLEQEIVWPKVAQLVTSKSESETHVWMDRIPQLRKWVGDRIIQGASLRSYELKNDPYELTEGLDQYRIEDNKISSFEPTVRMMAEQAKKWPDTLIFTATTGLLAAGATALTYDGQAYFSTAHPVNMDNPAMGTQSNYAASGKALNYANFGFARQTMRGYKGADGLPLKVNPKLLVVPPALETAAIQICHEEMIAPGTALGAGAANVQQGNPYVGMADILVVDDLAGADTTWYLLDNTKSIKPFLFQLREAAKFVMKTRPDDPAIFSRHEVQYGTNARGAAGYGPWFLASSWTA